MIDVNDLKPFDATEIGNGTEGSIVFRDENGKWSNAVVGEAAPWPDDIEGFEKLAKVLETLPADTDVLLIAMNHYETSLITGPREGLLDFGVYMCGSKEIVNGDDARELLDRTGSVGYDEAYLALGKASELLAACKLR